jgi:hypothetical protein
MRSSVFSNCDRKPNAYSEKDLRLAERVGIRLPGAIANAQLLTNTNRRKKRWESEKRFKDLYDNAPLGYHEYDRKDA